MEETFDENKNEEEIEVTEENEFSPEDEISEENIEAQIKQIKIQLQGCEKQKSEYLAGWQRARADFINARKEEGKNRELFINLQKENLLLEFLSVADAFEIAFRNESWVKMEEKWRSGIEAIYSHFKKILDEYNVRVFESLGEKFNPEKHLALEAADTEDKEKDDVILEELQKGYIIGDKILRPAKVKVGVYKVEN